MSHINRPLSPHLPIYKVQVTSLFSILHRLGELFILGLGAVLSLVFFWAVCIPDAPYLKEKALEINKIPSFSWFSCFIYMVFAIISFCCAFHAFNTLRYIFWDFGKGFDIVGKTAFWAVVMSAIVSVLGFSMYFFLTESLLS